jgi:hypothetical protein
MHINRARSLSAIDADKNDLRSILIGLFVRLGYLDADDDTRLLRVSRGAKIWRADFQRASFGEVRK